MRLKKWGIVALIHVFTLFPAVINSQTPIKAVIYDLHGVLSKIDNLGVAGEIGFWDAAFYNLFDATKFSGIEQRLFKTLEAIGGVQDAVDGHLVCNGHSKPLPNLMCRWMDGSFNAAVEKPFIMAELKRLYCAGFFKNNREYRVLRNLIICMFFQPKRLNKHKKPIKDMIKIAYDIKKNGKHRQFLLSNIDALGFADLLTSEMGHTLKRVIPEKNLIASAHIGYNKPHPKAYLHILNLHNLKPEECVFIDDQRENIVAARKIGMIGLQVKDKNYKKIRNQLSALGVL